MTYKHANNPNCICREYSGDALKIEHRCPAIAHGPLAGLAAEAITQVSGEKDPARDAYNAGSPDYRRGYNDGQATLMLDIDQIAASKSVVLREKFTDEGYTRALIDCMNGMKVIRRKLFAIGFAAGVGACVIIHLLAAHFS